MGFGAVDASWWLERKKPRCTSIEYDTPEAGTDLDLDVVLMVDSVFSLINVSGGRLMASGCRMEQDLCICQPGWQHSSSPSPARTNAERATLRAPQSRRIVSKSLVLSHAASTVKAETVPQRSRNATYRDFDRQ